MVKSVVPPAPFWPGPAVVPRLGGPWVLWALGSVFIAGLILATGGGVRQSQLRSEDSDVRARALAAGSAVAQQELLAERNCQRYLLTGDSDALLFLQEAELGIKQALATGAALAQELHRWAPGLGAQLETVRDKLWIWRASYSMPAIEFRLAGRWNDLDRFNRRDGQGRWVGDVDTAIRDFRAQLLAAVDVREAAHEPQAMAAELLLVIGVLLQCGALLAAVPLALRYLSAVRDRSRLSIALKSFTNEIRDATSEVELTGIIALAAMGAGRVKDCIVLLTRPGGIGLSVAKAVGQSTAARRTSAVLDQPLLCPVMSSGRPHLVGNVRTQPVCACPLGVPTRGAYACVPLMAQDRAYGLMNVQTGAPRVMREEHIRDYFEALGFIGSLALAAHQDLTRMQRDAMTDTLTGVYNRRFLDASLKLQLASASRSSTSMSILMMDLDHFKRFNDTHGHTFGDALLQSFGGCIQTVFREADILARYGGEEFVAVLPDTTTDQAIDLGERLRRRIRTLVLPGLEHLPQPVVTISVGVGSYPEHGASVEEVLRVADQALYQAKRAGRDQVGRFNPVKTSTIP